MTAKEFIANMKRRADSDAKEAERCRRDWKLLAHWAFSMAVISAFATCLFVFKALLLGLLFLAITVLCVVGGLWNLRTGEMFAARWMKLREECLREAKDAEQYL